MGIPKVSFAMKKSLKDKNLMTFFLIAFKSCTMWALTRVNIFGDHSRTYEIMALQNHPIGRIPNTSECVFIVLPDGNTVTMNSSCCGWLSSHQSEESS